MAASLLALGLDPDKCTLFVQSHRPEHTELAWLLSTVTPVSWLERTPTYKEKRETQPDDVNHGLLTYPVLQAADIAMYKATLVPVGRDQAAHLEISREIVRAFNNRYSETFPEPQAVFTEAPTVLGTDGVRKMSKSVGNTIDVLSDPDTIRKQVMSMVTDTQRIMRTDPGRPEVCNVCQLQRFFGDDYESLWDGERTARTGCVDMKRLIADRIVAHYAPARERYLELQSKPEHRRRDPLGRREPPRADGDRHDLRSPPEDGTQIAAPMGFDLTPRERRWFDAILVLGAVALGFIVLGFVGVVFAYFGELIMVFFLAWLLAFMLGPVVKAVTAIPLMTRTGAIFTTYLILFGGLVVVTIVVAAALFSSLQDFIGDLPQLRTNLPGDPGAVAGAAERAWDSPTSTCRPRPRRSSTTSASTPPSSSQPLQQLAVASLGAIGNLLLVVVLSLYMVADRDRIQAFSFWLVPTNYRTEAEILEEAVSRSFGGFIRGQVITGLAFAAICLAASLAFGLEFVPSRRPSPACSWRSRSSGRSLPGFRRSSWRSCPSPMRRSRSGSWSRSAGSWS